MTLTQAKKELRKIGAANAQGDALRACYAQLASDMHGGKADIYFQHLAKFPEEIRIGEVKKILQDRAYAWDVLLGIAP